MTEKEYFDLQLSSNKNDPIFDIKALLFSYLKAWKFFLISLVFFVGAALVLLQFINSSYEISSKILLKKNAAMLDNTGNASVNSNPFKTSEIVNNQIEMLTSVSLMKSVMDSLSLQCYYRRTEPDHIFKQEVYGDELPFKVLVDTLFPLAFKTTLKINIEANQGFEMKEEFEDSSDGNTNVSRYNFGDKIEKPYGIFTVVKNELTTGRDKELVVEFRDNKKMAQYYVKNILDVQVMNKDATVIKLLLIEEIPQKGEDIINKLIDIYRKNTFVERNLVAINKVNFIDNRLKLLSGELSEVEMNVAQFKTDNQLTNVEFDANSFSEQQLDYGKKLAESEIELQVLDAIERNLKRGGNQSALSSLSISSPTLINLIDNYNRLQLEKERLQRTVAENNPKMISIRDQLGLLRNNILGNLATSKQSLTISINSIRNSSIQFARKKQKIPTMERQLVEISREQGIKEKLFLYLLQKREEAALMIGAKESNFSVIDKAMTDFESVSPNKTMLLLLALIISLAVPIGFIHLKAQLNTKVETKRDVGNKTKVPILGEIVHCKSINTLIHKGEDKTQLAQDFRMMKVDLEFIFSKKNIKTILITSTTKGEGKTFFASNMGVALASSNTKVLIIELDKENLTLLKVFGEEKQRLGITNYLTGKDVQIKDLLISVKNNPNLFAIGQGTVKVDALEVYTSQRMSGLMEELRQTYDYIILDSSPMEKLADTFALSEYVDACLYMVRSNYTNVEGLKIIEDIAANNKFANPMVVINDVHRPVKHFNNKN